MPVLLGDSTGTQSGVPWIGQLIGHVKEAHGISDDQLASIVDPISLKMVYMGIIPPEVPVLYDCRLTKYKRTGAAAGVENAWDALRTAICCDDAEFPNADHFVCVECPNEQPRIHEWKDIDNNTTMAQLVRGRVDATVCFVRTHPDEGSIIRAWYTMLGN